MSVGLFTKFHTEIRVGPFVTTADVHFLKHSHQPTRNHLFQTLNTRAAEHTSNSKLLLNFLGK